MKKVSLVVLIIVLVLFAFTLSSTKWIVEVVWGALKPVALGVFFALLLKPMISFFEKTIFSSKRLSRWSRGLSVITTLTLTVGFLVLICYLIVPELVKSVESLKSGLSWALEGGVREKLNLPARVENWLSEVAKKGGEWLSERIPHLLSMIEEVGRGIVNLLLGLMLGVTLLWGEGKIGEFFEKIFERLLGKKQIDFLKGTLKALVEKFSKYLGGSLIEATLFGLVSYVALRVFKVPYPLLIAVVVAVFNLIPTLGGYIGGGIGVLIILTVGSEKVLTFILIMLVIQQVEQFTTYPIIVGKYVGLNPFFVLLAVVIGGGLFGFWGLLLGVPTFAFLYNLVEVTVEYRKKDNKIQDVPKSAP